MLAFLPAIKPIAFLMDRAESLRNEAIALGLDPCYASDMEAHELREYIDRWSR